MSSSTADKKLKEVCAAAKAKKVIIFTINFESNEDAMRVCASSDSHYYLASGLNIQAAFKSIETAIQNIKLTN